MNDVVIAAYEFCKRHGYEYKTNNAGIHMQLITPVGRVDLWPTTGKWSIPSLNKKGFTLRALRQTIEANS